MGRSTDEHIGRQMLHMEPTGRQFRRRFVAMIKENMEAKKASEEEVSNMIRWKTNICCCDSQIAAERRRYRNERSLRSWRKHMFKNKEIISSNY